jgi:sec-independent protein translocase protein TatC
MMTDISRYLDFVLVMFLAFGLSFELPVAVVILAAAGLGDAEAAEGRRRGYVIVGIFVLAALITPPDVISQVLLALPMVLLYEVGLVFARWLAPRQDPG